MDRTEIVHNNFERLVAANDLPSGRAPTPGLTDAEAVSLYRAQCLSRALDRASRSMQKAGQGFYTIGSSGHEGMAAVAHALSPTDMAFLHYRDAAFQIARASQVPGQSIAWDMLLSFAAMREDPISGGRHKVLGSKALYIPPQTSTIASHLPKAVGVAHSIGLARRHPPEHSQLPCDAIVVCSFGDASANHSTAQGAMNTAGWMAYQRFPLPLLFVCEDNGIGISTKTPHGWIAASFSARPGLRYYTADGLDFYHAYAVTSEAVRRVRRHRQPAFLHLRTVRLHGHAGADLPTSYMSSSEIEADEAHDPLLHSVRLLRDSGALAPGAALAIYRDTCERIGRIVNEVVRRPRLETAEDVMASIIPPARVHMATKPLDKQLRENCFKKDFQAMAKPQPMSRLINWALTEKSGDGDWMDAYPEPGWRVPLGEVGIHGNGQDLAIVTYGNGHYLARQAEAQLRQLGISSRIVDLRWLSPLPLTSLLAAVLSCRRILIVDECRRSGNLSEGLMSLLVEHTDLPVRRITAEDSFIATGPAYAATMPSVAEIIDAATRFAGAA
jgi:2-oxoisovalerate dehydrogenase E1 component